MAARGETRARVLKTAGTLFSRQGFHATGVNQILAESAAPKGSLYFHFPGGKEQLVAEAVGVGARELGQVIDEVIAHAHNPGGAITAMADLLARRLEESNFVDGCPIATVALEVGADNTAIREACCVGYGQWLRSITDYLTDCGVDTDTAADLALLGLSFLEGALLLARTHRDTAPVHKVAARIAVLINQEIAS